MLRGQRVVIAYIPTPAFKKKVTEKCNLVATRLLQVEIEIRFISRMIWAREGTSRQVVHWRTFNFEIYRNLFSFKKALALRGFQCMLQVHPPPHHRPPANSRSGFLNYYCASNVGRLVRSMDLLSKLCFKCIKVKYIKRKPNVYIYFFLLAKDVYSCSLSCSTDCGTLGSLVLSKCWKDEFRRKF